MYTLIISRFGFHLANSLSFLSPDHLPRRNNVSPHLWPAQRCHFSLPSGALKKVIIYTFFLHLHLQTSVGDALIFLRYPSSQEIFIQSWLKIVAFALVFLIYSKRVYTFFSSTLWMDLIYLLTLTLSKEVLKLD